MKKEQKSEKRLKKEKAMFAHMETHLKSKEISAKIIKVGESLFPTDDKDKDPKKIDVLKLVGAHTTNKPFKFIIDIHEEDVNNNGHPQVTLNLEADPKEAKFVQLYPQTNGQLTFMIENFQSGIENIKIKEFVEEKKEEKKEPAKK